MSKSVESTSLQEYRKYAIKAAKELRYDESCIHKIKQAKSEGEIARIMLTARQRSCEHYE